MHVTHSTTQDAVDGQIVNFPTCATIPGVGNNTQCTNVPREPLANPSPAPIPDQNPTTQPPPTPQPHLPTPIKTDRLIHYLQGYDPSLTSYLSEGFTSGFNLRNVQFYPQQPPKNLKSSYLLPQVVDKKLSKELQLGRISGPY